MIKKFFLYLLLFLLAGRPLAGKAQCTGCTTTVTNNAVAAYTVAASQTLCIASGLTYTGNITLNGGVVCNSGSLSNVTFLKGNFRNFGAYTRNSVNAGITGNLTIDNFSAATFSLGALTFSASSATYTFQLNVYKGSAALVSGAVTHNSGNFNIEVGRSNPSGNPVNTSTITIGGLFTTKTAFNMLVNQDASATFSNVVSLEGTGIKTVNNYGTVDCINNFNMVSAGSSASTVTVNNYKILYVRQFLNANYTSGLVRVNNYAGAGNLFSVTRTVTFSRAGNTLTNSGFFEVPDRLNLILGTIANTGTIVCNNLLLDGGTLNNSNYIKANVEVLVRNTAARLNNYNTIEAVNTFSNIAVVTFSTNSYLYTKNYYNAGASAAINGPTASITPDQYPRIYISDYSENSGVINKIMVYDASLTSTVSNIGFGFDAVSSPTRIASSTYFGLRGVSPGNGNAAVSNCTVLPYYFKVDLTSNWGSPILYGSSTALDAGLKLVHILNPGITLTATPVSTSAYTWQPGGSNAAGIIVTPQSNQTYTAQLGHLNCAFINTLTIALNLNALARVDHIIPDGNDATGNIYLTVNGGTAPYTYNWLPGNITTKDLTNVPAGTYTVTVSDNASASVSYVYKLGYKTRWKDLASSVIRNDSIIGSAEVVTKSILKPNTDGWMEASVVSSEDNFRIGFTDSLSRNRDRFADMSICVLLSNRTLYLYQNGVYQGVIGYPVVGSMLRIEKQGSSCLVKLNGLTIHTVGGFANNVYKVKLLNYLGSLANIGCSFSDSTDYSFRNYLRTKAYVKHCSGRYIDDGKILLRSVDNEQVSYVFPHFGVKDSILEGTVQGGNEYVTINTNSVQSVIAAPVNYKVRAATINNGIYRADSLVANGAMAALAITKNVLRSQTDGELSYAVETSFGSRFFGFNRQGASYTSENEFDFGVMVISYVPGNAYYQALYYTDFNGSYTFIGYCFAGDQVKVRRRNLIFEVLLNDEVLFSGIESEPAIDRTAAFSVSSGYSFSNLGASFTTTFNVNAEYSHADYQQPVNGSATISPISGYSPLKYVWSDGILGRERNDLLAKPYKVIAYADTVDGAEMIGKVLNIGTSPFWRIKLNSAANKDSAWVLRNDSLGVLISENGLTPSNPEGWVEFKITRLNQVFCFGFALFDANITFGDSAQIDSALKTKMPIAYQLLERKLSGNLIYDGNGLLTNGTTFNNVNMIAFDNGQVRPLINGTSQSTVFTYHLNDRFKIKRNTEGYFLLYRNDTLIYTHSQSTMSGRYLQLVESHQQTSQAKAIGVITDVSVPFINLPKVYAVPYSKKDGGYYMAHNKQVLFKLNGEYNKMPLRYKVYDRANHAVIATNSNSGLLGSSILAPGDNRYTLNVSSLAAGYYILELINEKNEKKYLRFKVPVINP